MSKENRHGTGTPDDGGNIEFSITIEIADGKGLDQTGRGLGDVVLKRAITIADQGGKQLARRSGVRHN